MSRIGKALLVVLPDVNDIVFLFATVASAMIGPLAGSTVQHGPQPLLDISSSNSANRGCLEETGTDAR
jgi:hypothetical protein